MSTMGMRLLFYAADLSTISGITYGTPNTTGRNSRVQSGVAHEHVGCGTKTKRKKKSKEKQGNIIYIHVNIYVYIYAY